ncbi:MAG: CbtA family protein [Mesorhizobium sp.]|nr:CbtA family protein [Mesorhizobium sp.]MBL8575997.1 CbtA family protein [Mesorhizobium sp.]
MSYFRNVVFLAAAAGLLAGVVLAALQTLVTVPLILQAETFEGAAPMQHAGMEMGDATAESGVPAAPESVPAAEQAEEAWSPADGMERFLYTLGANVVGAIGFSLLLVVASEFAGGVAGWRQGLLWGLAGFAAFVIAPSLGLPPNMPAMPVADTLSRQIWWAATAAATGAGLALIILRSSAPLAVLGLLLIIAPHIWGAPQPASYDTSVPEGLHQQFIVAVTLTNLVFWAVLGATIGALRKRFADSVPQPVRGFA